MPVSNTPRKRKMSRKETIILSIVLAFIVLIILIVSIYMFFTLQTDAISATIKDGENIRVAMLLHDGNTVVASLVAFYQPNTGQLMSLQVPSNIGVLQNANRRYMGIGDIFDTENMKGYLDQLSTTLGTTITWYYMCTPEQLAGMLDLLGGFSVEIVDSTTQETHELLLNGDTISYYIGDEYQNYANAEDSSKEIPESVLSERFNSIIQGILLSMSKQVNYLLHSQVQKILLRNLSTNLDSNSLNSFIKNLAFIREDGVYTRSVHGIKRVIQDGSGERTLIFPYFDGEWLRKTVEQLEVALANEVGDMENLFMQVELLNGTRINGLARRTKTLMERYGFDIVNIGNASSFNIQKTQIISRSENLVIAQRIGEIIHSSNIIYQPGQSGVDVTIVLGADFDGQYVRQ